MVGRDSNNRFRAKTNPCGTVHTPGVSMLPFLVVDAHRSTSYACPTLPPASVSTNRTLLALCRNSCFFGRDDAVKAAQSLCEKAICRHCPTRESCGLDRRPTGLKLSNTWPKRSPSQRIYTGFVGQESGRPLPFSFGLFCSVPATASGASPLLFWRTNSPNLRTDLFPSAIS